MTIVTGLGARGRSPSVKANGRLAKAPVVNRMRPNDEENDVKATQKQALAVEMASRTASELAASQRGAATR